MKITIATFDDLVNQLDIKDINAEPNAAAKKAGFAVETYLRRKDVKVNYISIKIERGLE